MFFFHKSQRMYGEGWVWITTDGGTSLNVDKDIDLNTTTAGFIGIAPESRWNSRNAMISSSLDNFDFFFVVLKTISLYLFCVYFFFSVYRGSMLVDIFIEWYGTADTKTYPGRIWEASSQPAISPYVAQVFRAVSAYHSVLTALAAEKKLTLVRIWSFFHYKSLIILRNELFAICFDTYYMLWYTRSVLTMVQCGVKNVEW